jgi:hypothetical protein
MTALRQRQPRGWYEPADRRRCSKLRISSPAALKRLSVILAACIAAAVASVIVWGGSASASANWSSTGALTFTDTKTGVALTCSASTATMVPTNSGTNPVGHITSISFTGCIGPTGVTVTLTAAGLDWPVSAQPAARAIGETSGGHGVAVDVSAPACSADVDGTGAGTDTGKVHFTFSHASGSLGVVLAGGNLHIYDVSGCAGLIGNGDPVSFSVSYRIG